MLTKLKSFSRLFLGTAIAAVALDVFLAPFDIAPGGVSGLAIAISHLIDLPVGVLIFSLNIPIFVWGFRHFGKTFVLYSLLGMLLLSVFTDAFAFFPKLTNDKLLCSIYGGVMLGLGIGLVFSAGFTTGGTDIIVQILKDKRPSLSIGRLILTIDAFVIIFAGIVFFKWETLLYSTVAVYISSFIIDLIVEGGDSAKVAYIISENPKALAEAISNTLGRGTTHIHASSFYSNSRKSVLLCVLKKYEVISLKALIKNLDRSAFVILSDAREVLGNGFNEHQI